MIRAKKEINGGKERSAQEVGKKNRRKYSGKGGGEDTCRLGKGRNQRPAEKGGFI